MPHRRVEPARRIEAQNDELRVLAQRMGEAALDVLGAGRADDARHVQRDDRRRRGSTVGTASANATISRKRANAMATRQAWAGDFGASA